MLRSLDIRDVLIIDRLELAFQPGLNVLTGETGAGKSIMLDCLGMALGWRGRADVVRPGAHQAEVSAEFDIDADHPANAVLRNADLPIGETLLLRRVSAADGRRQVYVNDRRASAETIRALADCLVEVHGQNDDRGLLDPKGHLAILDQYAGSGDQARSVRQYWQRWRLAADGLATAQAELALAQRDAEYLRHSAAELDKFAPLAGEEEDLDHLASTRGRHGTGSRDL